MGCLPRPVPCSSIEDHLHGNQDDYTGKDGQQQGSLCKRQELRLKDNVRDSWHHPFARGECSNNWRGGKYQPRAHVDKSFTLLQYRTHNAGCANDKEWVRGGNHHIQRKKINKDRQRKDGTPTSGNPQNHSCSDKRQAARRFHAFCFSVKLKWGRAILDSDHFPVTDLAPVGQPPA